MEKRSHNAYFMRPELREKKLLYHYCAFVNGMSLNLLKSKISAAPRLILVSVCISLAQFGDWSYMIPVWTIIFHVYRDDRRRSAALFTIVSLVLQTLIWLPQYDSFAAFFYQYGALLSLIPLHYSNSTIQENRRSIFTKAVYYLYYPSHMFLLTLIFRRIISA